MPSFDPTSIIPAACEQLLSALPGAECTWVPAYIAYGLLENLALDQNVAQSKIACLSGKGGLAPIDQDLHRQMLKKLALHLAVQPGLAVQPKESQAVGTKLFADDKHSKADEVKCQSFSMHGQELQRKNLSSVSAHDQEFQQEMLRKLALHLAAQDLQTSDKEDTSAGDFPSTPEVFPATPSSFGEDDCEHYFIGDEVPEKSEEEEPQQESCRCWPASSHLVSVPRTLAHGLLGVARGQENQEFHQQMLQKLALHLAAQSEDEVPKHRPPRAPHSRVSSPQPSRLPSSTKPSDRWADMVDDDDSPGKSASCPAPCTTASVTVPVQQQFQHDMLRKLALHLVAQPEPRASPECSTPESVEFARALGEDKARCDELLAQLHPPTSPAQAARITELVDWLLPGVRALSLTPSGCRLVQEAIDVASSGQCHRLVASLLAAEGLEELYMSPHANHVLTKIIVSMPPKKSACIAEAMRDKATTVARHQFGSRVMERLIEHCGEGEIGFLFDELLEDCEPLARHLFGNFVVASMFKHGDSKRKEACVHRLLPHVLQHATHKTACNIVQRIMESADLVGQASIADAFLAGTGETSLEAIAATRYGSFVIQHLVDKFHPRIDAVKARIKAAHRQLQQSSFSQRKIVRFLGEGFFRN